MRSVRVAEMDDMDIDAAVILIERGLIERGIGRWDFDDETCSPATDWAVGGRIIEEHRIRLEPHEDDAGWSAWWVRDGAFQHVMHGPTALVAAMRCFIASQRGEAVELP